MHINFHGTQWFTVIQISLSSNTHPSKDYIERSRAISLAFLYMASKAYLFIIGTLLIFLHRDKAFAVPHKHPNLVPTKAFHKHNSLTSSREFYSTQSLRSTPSEYLRPYTKGVSIQTCLVILGVRNLVCNWYLVYTHGT